MRISTSISSSARALVNMPCTKSAMGMVRWPPGPWATTSAPVDSRTEFQSPSGSQWATEPQKVPRLRTSGSATHGAAAARTPKVWGDETTWAWRTSAPMRRCPLVRSMVSSPGNRLMSTSLAGLARRIFIIGRRLCPPARNRVSSPPSALALRASSRVVAAT